MPIIKSAHKRMRSSARKQVQNLKVKQAYKGAVKEARANKSDETVKKAYKALDKAAKQGVIHANKASRLKSRITKNPASK
jgi:small subunit ribosomal protein S20